MPLQKISKHVVYGSILVAHYSVDINDSTIGSSSFTRWGQTVAMTPQYNDSHIESVFTGSMFTSSDMTTNIRYGNMGLYINGQQEYLQTGVLGGKITQQGTQTFSNPTHQEHNGRQQFHYNNFGRAVYMQHIYAPGDTNELEYEVRVSSDSGSLSIQCKDGFLTLCEISGEHFNIT